MVTDEERKKALEDARAAATAKLQGRYSDMSENEQALFFAIEQGLGLDKETCIRDLRKHKEKEFARMAEDEYNRNLDALKEKQKWTTESFKALETAMVPVDATRQKIFSWDFRFKDEITGVQCSTIREIFRSTCTELADPLVIVDRKRFIREVSNKHDREIVEGKFDRKEIGWSGPEDDNARYLVVKFMLRAREKLSEELHE